MNKKFLLILLLVGTVLSGCSNNSPKENVASTPVLSSSNAQNSGPAHEEKSTEISQPVASNINRTFRSVDWGMSLAEVKSSESAMFIEETSNTLVYRDTVNDLKADLEYEFNPDAKLISAEYSFELKNTTDYIKAMLKLKESLTDKYGEATDDTFWVTSETSDISRQAKAIENRNVVYGYLWETENSKIELALFNSTKLERIRFYIRYDGTKFPNTPSVKDNL